MMDRLKIRIENLSLSLTLKVEYTGQLVNLSDKLVKCPGEPQHIL